MYLQSHFYKKKKNYTEELILLSVYYLEHLTHFGKQTNKSEGVILTEA